MSYQVLARKWRPKTFREMAGQEHVLKALVNALDHDRLHHAYLFTGTRGVGKTSIARIFAKCLNCETGVSSEPCGSCSACESIANGSFVDLIEVDAASKTKVDDTRELLENVQYAPSIGRYKVYLIDEVHMLSASSFNALLKTLEEPPPHVKFLLATTDPQKIPATVLSRCLQFSLKNMSPERVVEHLKFVLDQEMVSYDEPSLWLLGRAAEGSMRDALSLTDQAISFGSGKLVEAELRQMLGTIDQGAVYRIVGALAAGDGAELLQAIADLSEHAVDYASVLEELLNLLHRVAIAQAVPGVIDNSLGDRDKVKALAGEVPAEDVQFYYQIALHGRRDLPLAPDARSGLEMALLRMLAFKPAGVPNAPSGAALNNGSAQNAPQSGAPAPVKKPEPPTGAGSPAASAMAAVRAGLDGNGSGSASAVPPSSSPSAAAPIPTATSNVGENAAKAPVSQTPSSNHGRAEASPNSGSEGVVQQNSASSSDEPPWHTESPAAANNAPFSAPGNANQTPATPSAPAAVNEPTANKPAPPKQLLYGKKPPEPPPVAKVPKVPVKPVEKLPFAQLNAETWSTRFTEFGLPGMLGSIASHCQFNGTTEHAIHLTLDQNNASLFDDRHAGQMSDKLSDYFGAAIQVQLEVGEISAETPAAYRQRRLAERMVEAKQALSDDPTLQMLINEFDGVLDESSIELVDPAG